MNPRRASFGAVFAITLAALAAFPSHAAEPVINVTLDRSQVSVGEPFFLTIELRGFSGGADPELPRIDGIDAYEAGRSTNISMINGRFSSSTSVNYQMVARREGAFTIGPVTVSSGGRVYSSDPITVQVGAAAAPPPGQAPPVSRSAPAGGTPQPTGTADGLFARVVTDESEASLDEQITLRFQLYRREDVPLLGTRDFTPPTSEGFWREDLGPEQHYTVQIKGQTYVVTELSWALFPTKTGDLEIGPAGIMCFVEERARRRSRDLFSDFFDRDFFGRSLTEQRPISLTTDPVRIHVRALPESGRPAGFSGSVGRYTVSADVDSRDARAGEPVTLTVKVQGSGHIQTIGAPVWPEWNGLRVYDSGEAVSVNKRDNLVVGEKQFTQVLIPTRRGEIVIPAIDFAFFDPDANRYQTVSTAPIPLNVAAGGPAAGDDEAAAIAASDEMLYVEGDLMSTLSPRDRGGFSSVWLIHLLPLGAIGAAVWLRRRREVFAGDPLLARRSRAYKRAMRDLRALDGGGSGSEIARRLAYILETYLGDWIGSAGAGLRRGELGARLHDVGLAEPLAQQALAYLAWSDEVRFAAGRAEEANARAAELPALLRSLEDGLRAGAHARGKGRVRS